MGFLDELKKLTKPYDDEDDFFGGEGVQGEDDDPTIVVPRTDRQERAERQEHRNPFDDVEAPVFEERTTPKKDNKVVNIHTTTAVQVVLSKPERFEQAAEIADHLREKRTVVMNLETTNKDVARRLVKSS